MTTESKYSFKGQFLIAMPQLHDPNFYKTVTCISEHNTHGAVGVIINQVQPLLSAKLIFDELNIDYLAGAEDIPIYLGGPVHLNEIFILHGPPFDQDGCLLINQELALSNSRAILNAIAQQKGPKSYIICLGCAGWGPGQLDYEIKENVWVTTQCSNEIIFNRPLESRWEDAIKQLGIDPALLSDIAGHA